MKFFYVLLLAFALLGAGCKKESITADDLPPITQTGANTFGCLINGKAFITDAYAGTSSALAVEFDKGELRLQIHASNKKLTPLPVITIAAEGIEISSGITYKLYTQSTLNAASASYFTLRQGNSKQYDISASSPGILKITKFDATQKIISGTFAFDAVTEDGKKAAITEGRFDLKY